MMGLYIDTLGGYMHRIARASIISLLLSFFVCSGTVAPVFARTRITNVRKPTQYTTVGMSLMYTLRPRRFSLRATGIKNVSYTITYQRTGGKMTEALTGGGRTKNGLFTRSHFAGSQSSKYFIPHNVLSGHIQFDAVTLAGENYSINRDFVIRRGKLVYTN